MAYILQLETSTKQCSVALAFNGKPIASKKLLKESFSHSEKLHLFISELLKEAHLKPIDLDAVAVSKGPGSYTGLRIGVAAAKGICFALEIPLIALNALEILAQTPPIEKKVDFIIPMLDARRMEVYTAVFDCNKNWIQQTTALVLAKDSFLEVVKEKPCVILGDGAQKFKELTPQINAYFPIHTQYPNADDMSALAWKKYTKNEFESLAYFEPYYLKEFQTTPPKK